MKLYLPSLIILLFLASCSTAYKTGQTPDDVYFSPERQRDEYARVEKKESRYNEEQRYATDEDYREDRYLRMKTSYRRYSVLDDCDCYCYNGSNYNRYYDYYRNNNWGYYNRWNTVNWNYNPYAYNPYYYNPYYNKPYYGGYVAGNVRPPVYNKPRTGNLSTYYNNGNNSNSGYQKGNRSINNNSNNATNSSENYRNSGTNAGGFLRNVFGSGSNNNSSSTSSSPAPSSSSSSSGSSGSSSSGSTAPARKF